jgi:hypothetical protein
MGFARSSRSKRPSSPEPPPKPPRPQKSHQRADNGLGAPYNQAHRPYTSPAGAFSVGTFHASPPVGYHQNMAMSMAHLPPTSAPPMHPFPALPANNLGAVNSPSRQPQKLSKWKSYANLNQSMTHLVSHTVERTNATILDLENLVYQSMGGGANVNEATSRLLDQVITSIDLGSFCGRESELSGLMLFFLFVLSTLLIHRNSRCMHCSVPGKRKERSSIRSKGKETCGFSGLFLQGVPLCQLTTSAAFDSAQIVSL